MQQILVRGCFIVSVGVALSACGAGDAMDVENQKLDSGAGETTSQTEFTSPRPSPQQDENTYNKLRGQITYDRPPFFQSRSQGLDFHNTDTLPIRGATVQLLDANNTVLDSTLSNEHGMYVFNVFPKENVRVRVLAELRGEGSATWNVRVRDNTRGNALYVLDGGLANTNTNRDQTRNLHASSGWTGAAYTEARNAGPFAILDSIYDAVQLMIAADPNIDMPPLSVYWSEGNIAVPGNLSEGYISTSFYTSVGPAIYLLGAANSDTDEFDRGVIQHEFGHYLEHNIGRADTIGGRHSQSSKLDMRVAFGEALGNALAGMASNDPVYRDSLGQDQGRGFAIDVDQPQRNSQGWFSQASIQTILYHLFDDSEHDQNRVGLGFTPIYRALTSPSYSDFDGFTSIYSFIAQLKQQNPEHAVAIDRLVKSFQIYGEGWYGEGETNNAGSAVVLPLYHNLSPGQTINVCSDNRSQDYNGFDVRRNIRLHLPHSRQYSIELSRSGGELVHTNPEARLHKKGRVVATFSNREPNHQSINHFFNAGHYVLEVYERTNLELNNSNGGLACFDITLN